MSLIERCNGQSAFGNACNNIANAKNIFSSLAELLQMSKRRKWSLQNFCKCPKGEIGACRTSANTQKEKSELAETLQVPRKTFWSLQECCKCLEKLLEFAETLQVPRKTFRRLQRRCKCFEKLFGVCSNAASISRNVLAHRETSVEPLCRLYSYVKLTLTRSCFEFIE